jgi:hypothetical protein
MQTLPTIASEGKKSTKAISRIGQMYSNTGNTMVSSVKRATPSQRRRKVARPEVSTLNEKLENSVQKETQGLDYKFVKKAFDIYTNLANNIRKAVQDLIQKVKSILGIGIQDQNIKPKSNSIVPTQSTEQIRETAEAQEKQVELQTDQNETLKDIKTLMGKMLLKLDNLKSGGGSGLLDTAVDAAILGSMLRRGRGASAAVRAGGSLSKVIKGGGAGKLANIRGASAPVKMLAKTSDKVVGAVTGAKQAVTGTASKAGSKALSLLGFGTALGAAGSAAAGSAAPAIAQSVAPVAAGIQNIPGRGFVMQPPSTPTTSPAQLLSSPASTTTQAVAAAPKPQAVAAAPKPGFFGRMLQTAKNIGTGAVGMVKQLGQGGLELAKAIKNPMAFLRGPGKSVILPALKRVPLLGTVIEGIIGYLNIPAIQQDPNLTPEQKKEAIGAELGKRFGSLVGTTIGGAVGTVGGPLGTILGGIVGSYGGEYVGNLIAEALGPKEIYEFASSIPMIGKYFNVDTAKPEGETPTATAESPSMQQAMTSAPAPTVAPTPASTTPSLTAAQVSPATQSSTGEAVRYQTQQNINAGLSQTAAASSDVKPVIINNYYNNGTKMVPMGQSGGSVVDGTAIPPDESGMAAALTRDAMRSSGFGVHV